MFSLYLRPFRFLIVGDEDSISLKSILSNTFDPAAITIRCASKYCNELQNNERQKIYKIENRRTVRIPLKSCTQFKQKRIIIFYKMNF